MKVNQNPLKPFTKKHLQKMRNAVIKTQKQYINGKQLIKCPLCILYSHNSYCSGCPHIVFNNMDCCKWLYKNCSIDFFPQIFALSNSTVIKRKCINRLELWKQYITDEINGR